MLTGESSYLSMSSGWSTGCPPPKGYPVSLGTPGSNLGYRPYPFILPSLENRAIHAITSGSTPSSTLVSAFFAIVS